MIINWFKSSVGGDINYSLFGNFGEILKNTEKWSVWVGRDSFWWKLESLRSQEQTETWGGGGGGRSSPCKKERIEQVRSVTVNIYIGQMLAKCFWQPCQTLHRWAWRGCLCSEHSASSPWKWLWIKSQNFLNPKFSHVLWLLDRCDADFCA